VISPPHNGNRCWTPKAISRHQQPTTAQLLLERIHRLGPPSVQLFSLRPIQPIAAHFTKCLPTTSSSLGTDDNHATCTLYATRRHSSCQLRDTTHGSPVSGAEERAAVIWSDAVISLEQDLRRQLPHTLFWTADRVNGTCEHSALRDVVIAVSPRCLPAPGSPAASNRSDHAERIAVGTSRHSRGALPLRKQSIHPLHPSLICRPKTFTSQPSGTVTPAVPSTSRNPRTIAWTVVWRGLPSDKCNAPMPPPQRGAGQQADRP